MEINMILLLALAVFTLSSSHAGLSTSPAYEVLVIVPHTDKHGSQSSLQDGDILEGVNLAEQSLSGLNLPFNLSIKQLRVSCVSADITSLVQLVRELTTNEARLTVAILGFFCKKTLDYLELIGVGSRDRLGLVGIAINAFLPAPVGSSRPLYYQMLPSSLTYAEALSQFTEWSGWTRVGVAFTQNQNGYHFEVSQQVVRFLREKQSKLSVETFKVTDDFGGHIQIISKVDGDSEAHIKHDIMQAIRSIHISGVKIVYVILPRRETIMLICTAYDYGLRWPDYGWVVLNKSLGDISRHTNCDSSALQGIISFQVSLDQEQIDHMQEHTYVSGYSFGIYAKAVYDSILATAFSLNLTFPQVSRFLAGESPHSKITAQRTISHKIGKTLESTSYQGALGNISFARSGALSEANIDVHQIINGKRLKIGTYTTRTNKAHYAMSTASLPSDKLKRKYSRLPMPLEAFLTTCMAICVLIAIVNLVLYICYRNAPEIKASSFRLSMVIHLCSFSMMVGGQLYITANSVIIDKSFKAECTLQNWLIFPWGDMILATLLVKMSRIHYIFKRRGKINLKLCSDTTLLVIIVVIVTGKVVIILLWDTLDLLTNTDVDIYHPEVKPPYYEVERHCLSHRYFLWLGTSLGYTATLGAVLGCVVFRVRRIKHKDFNDTKKINTTVLVSFIATGVVVPMWWTFRASGDTNASSSLLALLFMILPMSCQVCLFWPKTIPPLVRSVCSHNIIKKCTGSKPQLLKNFIKRLNSSKVYLMGLSSQSTLNTV